MLPDSLVALSGDEPGRQRVAVAVQVLGGAESGEVAGEPFDIMQWAAHDDLSKLAPTPLDLPAWALDGAQI